MPEDPFREPRRATAFGIGMIHGVGAETPTQILVFLTAAGAGRCGAGVVVLVCFIAGLVTANTAVALAAAGLLRASGAGVLHIALSIVIAALSLVVGAGGGGRRRCTADQTSAHPLGNFTTNVYAGLIVGPDTLSVDYVLDLAEIPALPARAAPADNGDDQISDRESSDWAAKECGLLAMMGRARRARRRCSASAAPRSPSRPARPGSRRCVSSAASRPRSNGGSDWEVGSHSSTARLPTGSAGRR